MAGRDGRALRFDALPAHLAGAGVRVDENQAPRRRHLQREFRYEMENHPDLNAGPGLKRGNEMSPHPVDPAQGVANTDEEPTHPYFGGYFATRPKPSRAVPGTAGSADTEAESVPPGSLG